MDQNEHQTLIKYIKYQFFKTALQFLLSISLFSLLLSNSSSLYFFYHSICFHFRTLISPLFTHNVERKYLFLVCNGLIVFLLRNLSSSSSSQVGSDYIGGESELSEIKAPVIVNEKAAIENVTLVAEEEDWSLNTEVCESGALVIEEEEEEEESFITEEVQAAAPNREGAEEEENEELSNTEELNKKFDEFIRRMKEELRFDAQRQLIAV